MSLLGLNNGIVKVIELDQNSLKFKCNSLYILRTVAIVNLKNDSFYPDVQKV